MCLQGFHNLTPVDPKWPLTSTENSIGFLYSIRYTYILNMRSVQASLLEIMCLQGFHNFTSVDPKWPLTSTKSNRLLVLNSGTPTYQIWDLSKLPFLRYHVYKVFTILPLLTPNDLWPPPISNRLLVLNKVHLHTQIWDLSKLPFLSHIMFTRFSQFDLCWPQMTFDLHQKQ